MSLSMADYNMLKENIEESNTLFKENNKRLIEILEELQEIKNKLYFMRNKNE